MVDFPVDLKPSAGEDDEVFVRFKRGRPVLVKRENGLFLGDEVRSSNHTVTEPAPPLTWDGMPVLRNRHYRAAAESIGGE